MDNVDRMYRQLVRTIRTRFPQYLTQPFSVGELHQSILPYRHHRRELGLETNEDYEITLTELLAGARDYLIVDDRMRDALRTQLESTNPDPSAFKQFATATVALSPAALRSLEVGPADETPRATTTGAPAAVAKAVAASSTAATKAAAAPPSSSATATQKSAATTPTRTSAPAPRSGSITPAAGDTCRSCGEALPAGRPITFCPHCGQNLTTMSCPACGSELEVGWKFCPTCGRPTTAR